MDLHVNSKFWFLSTPPHPSIPHPSPTSKQKEVCLANLSDILVGSKNNLLHGLGRNLESFLESDAHHSSLVNKKKKTIYLLYFNWYSRLPITRNKRNKQGNSFPNITLSECWLMLLSTSPTRQRPILKSGRNNNKNNNKKKKTKMARFTRGKSVFSPNWWPNQERLLESIAYLQIFPRAISWTRSIRLPGGQATVSVLSGCPYKAGSQKKLQGHHVL